MTELTEIRNCRTCKKEATNTESGHWICEDCGTWNECKPSKWDKFKANKKE